MLSAQPNSADRPMSVGQRILSLVDAPVAIDLFSGAGGLAEGLLKSGIHVVAAVELHPQPALTHAFNHPHTTVLVGDIRELDVALLEGAVRANSGDANVDLVAGGPPCQGFSSAGKKSHTDPRNSLFRQYVRVVEHFRPRMFLLENVPGFRSMYGGAIYREALEAMHSLGYETADDVVQAKLFGVPQTRRRFVMVGWLPGQAAPFEWPAAGQDQSVLSLFDTGARRTTAGEALLDLADLEPGWEATRYSRSPKSEFSRERRNGNTVVFNHLATQHRAKAVSLIGRIPRGGSIRDIPLDERGTKKLTMSKLHPDRIAGTVVSLPDDMLHFEQTRILTVRESARLQTFDDDFVFLGKRTSGFVDRRNDVPQYTQVGNAVPPVLGEALGLRVIASLGAHPNDMRDIGARRARQSLVVGSSGFAGYDLAPEAVGEVELLTTRGERLELPISSTRVPVPSQPAKSAWARSDLRRVSQWAPGVVPKSRPSWQTDDGAAN